MRLISIQVKNYRIHKFRKVELDPSLTVIGGPNESGKSTLIEAAHRALFLRSRTGGERQKEMVSQFHGTQPEVEVLFETAGRRYKVCKRFSGQSGFTRLHEPSGEVFHDSEAESRLLKLLGIPEDAASSANSALQQWSHLWVWQGKSGDDPLTQANKEKDSLVERLKEGGGVKLLQSKLDAQVMQEIARICAETFNRNGTPKASSPLAIALSRKSEAAEKLDQARERLSSLQGAIEDLQRAETEIKAASQLQADTSREKGALEKTKEACKVLEQSQIEQTREWRKAEDDRTALIRVENEIRDLRATIQNRALTLAPQENKLAALAQQTTDAQLAFAQANDRFARAGEIDRACRSRFDLATAHLQQLEKSVDLERLAARKKLHDSWAAELKVLQEKLATIPTISSAQLKKLKSHQDELSQARVRLHAIATGIEIVHSDTPVLINGESAASGSSCTLTEQAELTIGNACIKINPGGGTSLANARADLSKKEDQLAASLAELCFANVSEAEEALQTRKNLESDLQAVNRQIEGSGDGNLAQAIRDKQAELLSIQAEVQRRAELLGEKVQGQTVAEAKAWLERVKAEAASAESAAAAARKTSDFCLVAYNEATDKSRLLKEQITQLQEELKDAERHLNYLLREHGDDDTRNVKLATASGTVQNIEAALQKTRDAIAAINPEALIADIARADRVIERAGQRLREAEGVRQVAHFKLSSDGSSDPHAALEIAEADFKLAAQTFADLERKANAYLKLHELFLSEQQALADQFTQPFTQKIGDYLRCLFGPSAGTRLSLAENAFQELKLENPTNNGTFDFDALSGGTREQLSAAVRLAMAEVLAASHGGTLPIVFDDAFAYSDPQRVKALQRMLDLAARRGLQIIVVTCNPADYNELGAKLVDITRTASESGNEPEPSAAELRPETSMKLAQHFAVQASQIEQFIAELKKFGGQAGNKTLQDRLGFDDALYEKVRDELLGRGQIEKRKGRGGSVCLPGAGETQPETEDPA